MFGKWHLGDRSPFLPNNKGFDYFYGAHYSVDMQPYNVYRNEDIVKKAPVDKRYLTRDITEEILNYIDGHADNPFFIYYASPYPHFPALASDDFAGKSKGGTYGDCVEELDWSVGEIRKKLEEKGLTDNTLIIFTSDNGPWYEGNPGYHRGRKGENFDGGHMVPFVASYPGVIPKGSVVEETAMNIDFFPTFLKLAGIPLPTDRIIDGNDMMPLLTGEKKENVHDMLYFITGKKVLAVRDKEDYKYMVRQNCDYRPFTANKMGPFMFDMKNDVNESYDVTNISPEKAKALSDVIKEANVRIKTNPRGWLDEE